MEKMQYEDQLKLLDHRDGKEILELLLQLSHKDGQNLQFFNYYKEVPISSAAELLYLFGDTLICRSNPTQTRALKASRYTIIRSPQLAHDVYATAEYDAETDEITLSEFSYVELLPDRRNTLRVKIGGLFQVPVEAGTTTFTGKLKDLSLGGCALEVPDKELLGSFTYFYLNLSFTLQGQSTPQKLRVMARLLRFENDTNPCRCILLFEHDRRSEDLIGRYIAQRQAEIIRELKD
jgi:hypothetical protein